MSVPLSIVPEVGRGYMDTPVSTYYYLGGFIRSPHRAITYTTTLGVAVGSERLYYGKPPVNMQLLHEKMADTFQGLI